MGTTDASEKPISSMDEFYARYSPRERRQILRAMADGAVLEATVKLKRNQQQYPTRVALGLLKALHGAGLIEPTPSLERNVFESGDMYRITERGRQALKEAESAQTVTDSLGKVNCRSCGKTMQK